MTINLFQGGRRTAVVAAGLWMIFMVPVVVFQGQPPLDRAPPEDVSENLTYIYVFPKSVPPDKMGPTISLVGKCDDGFVMHHLSARTPKGTEFRFSVCAEIPVDSDRTTVREFVERQIEHYTGFLAELAQRADSGRDKYLAKHKRAYRWKKIGEYLAWLIAGWATLGITTLVLGWIMRGFLGIPMGSDSRPDPDYSDRDSQDRRS